MKNCVLTDDRSHKIIVYFHFNIPVTPVEIKKIEKKNS